MKLKKILISIITLASLTSVGLFNANAASKYMNRTVRLHKFNPRAIYAYSFSHHVYTIRKGTRVNTQIHWHLGHDGWDVHVYGKNGIYYAPWWHKYNYYFSSKPKYYYQKHVYHPGAKYVKARFKQTNSKRVAAKSGYGEYEKLINKKTNAWYESIHNYYNPDNRKARIRASWDFYPKDHIYWTNTRTGTTYKHLRKNIWVKVN